MSVLRRFAWALMLVLSGTMAIAVVVAEVHRSIPVATARGLTVADAPIRIGGDRCGNLWSGELEDGSTFLFRGSRRSERLAWVFHGGGSSACQLVERTEVGVLIERLVSEDYAVVLLDSADRGTGKWMLSRDGEMSLDHLRVDAVRAALSHREEFNGGMAEVGIGFSNGGAFVSFLAAQERFDAVAIIAARGHVRALLGSESPPAVFFAAGANDTRVPVDEILAGWEMLALAGVRAHAFVKLPEPIRPELFARISGIDRADAHEIHAALVTAGVISAEGRLIATVEDGTWKSIVPKQWESLALPIGEQLLAAHGGHAVSRAVFEPLLDFFDVHGGHAEVARQP